MGQCNFQRGVGQSNSHVCCSNIQADESRLNPSDFRVELPKLDKCYDRHSFFKYCGRRRFRVRLACPIPQLDNLPIFQFILLLPSYLRE